MYEINELNLYVSSRLISCSVLHILESGLYNRWKKNAEPEGSYNYFHIKREIENVFCKRDFFTEAIGPAIGSQPQDRKPHYIISPTNIVSYSVRDILH